MPVYRTIVVGTDGSRSSLRAVGRAAEIARDDTWSPANGGGPRIVTEPR